MHGQVFDLSKAEFFSERLANPATGVGQQTFTFDEGYNYLLTIVLFRTTTDATVKNRYFRIKFIDSSGNTISEKRYDVAQAASLTFDWCMTLNGPDVEVNSVVFSNHISGKLHATLIEGGESMLISFANGAESGDTLQGIAIRGLRFKVDGSVHSYGQRKS